ncbi:MAG: MBL fold metallo-hydrolase [Planctomycetes bacterium]|jgi:glyoxylase-like metal-dependent hydrolase (beta-lactamase superfamily II)|nr:MBL fold metallo-hydrolase [Planctomycetota bacterium]
MIVESLVVGMFAENAWIVGCAGTREAVLVDPGAEAEKIAAAVDRLGFRPVRILNTHGHLDHVGAVEELRRLYGIPFAIHEAERENVESLAEHAAFFGIPAPPVPEVDEWVKEGAVYTFGHCALRAVATPGHTAGGISYVAEGRVFAGDTLFAGSVGRTDLPGGDFEVLRRSIREKLFGLPPETVVHCGHGPDTTIGAERAGNPFVGDRARPDFI